MRRLLTLAVMVSTLVLAIWVTTLVSTISGPSAGAQTYPPTTIVVGGTEVTRGTGGSGASTGSALPFTGSDSAATYGLLALGLVSVGLILLIAARRRRDVLDRA